MPQAGMLLLVLKGVRPLNSTKAEVSVFRHKQYTLWTKDKTVENVVHDLFDFMC